MSRSLRLKEVALSLVAVAAAVSALTLDEARWSGPEIAMADFAYFAWPVVRIALIVAAVVVAIGHAREPHSLIVRPLTGTLLLLAAVQWLHPRGWPVLDTVLLVAAFAMIWRAYFQIHRHRESMDWQTALGVELPLGLSAGWITLTISSAIAESIWSVADLREGTLAVAWQSALLVVTLFFIGFGIEQTRAHPAYAVGALWGLIAIAVGASTTEENTLMTVAIVVALITVALFFIERAMFRYRARPQQPADR